jgi:hypothetical protein
VKILEVIMGIFEARSIKYGLSKITEGQRKRGEDFETVLSCLSFGIMLGL